MIPMQCNQCIKIWNEENAEKSGVREYRRVESAGEHRRGSERVGEQTHIWAESMSRAERDWETVRRELWKRGSKTFSERMRSANARTRSRKDRSQTSLIVTSLESASKQVSDRPKTCLDSVRVITRWLINRLLRSGQHFDQPLDHCFEASTVSDCSHVNPFLQLMSTLKARG